MSFLKGTQSHPQHAAVHICPERRESLAGVHDMLLHRASFPLALATVSLCLGCFPHPVDVRRGHVTCFG